MDKVFKIDSFLIKIKEPLFKEAVKSFVLDEEIDEESKESNLLCIKGLIKASYTPDVHSLNKISYEEIRRRYTDEEISKKVEENLRCLIEVNGGNSSI